MRQRNESKWRLWDDGRRVSTKIPLATKRNGMENVWSIEEGEGEGEGDGKMPECEEG